MKKEWIVIAYFEKRWGGKVRWVSGKRRDGVRWVDEERWDEMGEDDGRGFG